MQIARILLLAGILQISANGYAQTVHQIDVSRHRTVTISESNVDSILAAASTALQTDDDYAPGIDDIACNVALRRSGAVGTFQSVDTPANPATAAAIDQVLREPAFVKIVASIGFCGQPAIFHGCAARSRRMIAVVHPGNARGLVWAHEFGHSAGLSHRGNGRELMRGELASLQQNYVNAAECTSFTEGPPDSLKSASTMDLTGTSGALPPIEQLLETAIVDRFPYTLIARYPASTAKIVAPVLDDPGRSLEWDNAATVLGIVGDREAGKRLLRFIMDEAPVDVDANVHHRARMAAVFALGYYLNRNADPELEDRLEDWARGARPSVNAFASTDPALDADRAASFRMSALWAIALAARPSGAMLLDRRSSALLSLNTKEMDELAETYRRVQRVGLAVYYAAPSPR